MAQFVNPILMAKNLWAVRGLFWQLVKKQLALRYKGSYLGFFWAVLNPLAMLAVYTFVFSVVFSAKWKPGDAGHTEFALALFAGLIAFNLFSESVLAAPDIIKANRTYIKKMVFPIEILPMTIIGVALVRSLFSLGILLAGVFCVFGKIPYTVLFLPLIYLPLILFCMGMGWFLAALGVFVKDTSHVLGIVVLMVFFMTPIFYPITSIPEKYQLVLRLNPLCTIVEGFRGTIMWGQFPDLSGFFILTGFSLAVCVCGYALFMKHKKTFADLV